MIKEKTIRKKYGIRTEDCAVIANAMSKFECSASLSKNNITVNAKSVLGLISLNVKFGDTVYMICDGDDEEKAINKFDELLK